MAGLIYRKSLTSKDEPTLLYFIIDNSDTITVGDAITVNTDGHATLAGAGTVVAGIAVTVVDSNGLAVTTDSGTTNTWTVESDNETDKAYEVAIIATKDALFYNDADGTLATTNRMQFFDVVAASDQIDQATASDTSGQFQLISLDPDGDADVSKGLFKIAESQFDPYAQQ